MWIDKRVEIKLDIKHLSHLKMYLQVYKLGNVEDVIQ